MSYGYSVRVIKLNSTANSKSMGVQFGRVCIEHDIPVSNLSNRLGVTRQTVYNWFAGIHEPNRTQKTAIHEVLLSLLAE